jgi:hypothetical protein
LLFLPSIRKKVGAPSMTQFHRGMGGKARFPQLAS